MDRLNRLIELRDLLQASICSCESNRDLAALARQYRETIKEIEEIEGTDGTDEITEILGKRDAAGKPGAVRKDRSKV